MSSRTPVQNLLSRLQRPDKGRRRFFYDTEFIEDGKTIDLVSIGIVRDDGLTYYGIRKEADLSRANDWVKAHVLPLLDPPGTPAWRTTEQLRAEVYEFLRRDSPPGCEPDLWAYYGAYDHVALCQLWGPMVALPKGMPWYTNDVRSLCVLAGPTRLPVAEGGCHNALTDALWCKSAFEAIVCMLEKSQA